MSDPAQPGEAPYPAGPVYGRTRPDAAPPAGAGGDAADEPLPAPPPLPGVAPTVLPAPPPLPGRVPPAAAPGPATSGPAAPGSPPPGSPPPGPAGPGAAAVSWPVVPAAPAADPSASRPAGSPTAHPPTAGPSTGGARTTGFPATGSSTGSPAAGPSSDRAALLRATAGHRPADPAAVTAPAGSSAATTGAAGRTAAATRPGARPDLAGPPGPGGPGPADQPGDDPAPGAPPGPTGRMPRLHVGWHALDRAALWALSAVPPPAAGLVLGHDRQQAAVPVRLFGPEPVRAALVGGVWAAQLVIFRAFALGARVTVVTGEPTAWIGFGERATGQYNRLTVLGSDQAVAAAGTPHEPVLCVYDPAGAGPAVPGPPGPWRTQLTVLRRLDRAGVPVVQEAGLALLQRLGADEAALAATALRLRPHSGQFLQFMADDMVALVTGGTDRYLSLSQTPAEVEHVGPPRR